MKKIGILGAGTVGQQLGLGVAAAGYKVMIGTRDTSKLNEWKEKAGANASVGSHKDAAHFGEMIVFCPKWEGAEEFVRLAGKENFKGKIVIDTTNPLHFVKEGQAPTLSIAYPDSAGAIVQKWLPDAHVVKCFNTITAFKMCNGIFEEGKGSMLICGNDASAKKTVTEILHKWNWDVVDMGSIERSSLLEALAMTWIDYGFAHNHWTHGFRMMMK